MCHGCSYGGYNCGILGHVRNGRLIRVQGNPHHPLNKGKLCAKGQSAVQWVYNDHRLKYPLLRNGRRGDANFTRISWDKALTLAAEQIMETKELHGPEHIILSKGQSSGWGGLHHLLYQRLLHALGSVTFSNWGPSVCYAPQLLYHRQIIGGPTYARPDYDHADLIIEWFTGGGKGGPARGGVETQDTNLRSVPRKIINRLKKGARLVIINPQLIPLGANGRAYRWLPIRPGSDGALALAMIHVILKEELYDRDFVSRWCEGFDALALHVQKYSPVWAETVTDLPARAIEELARLYATTKRACIRFSEAPQKKDLRCFAVTVPILMAITGHLDRPGGNVWFLPAARLGFSTLPQKISPSARERVLGGDTYCIRSSGKTSAFSHSVINSLVTGKPYRPKAMIVFGSNPLSTSRNPRLVARAMDNLSFLIVVDVVPTPTARYADLILPAATRYECSQQPSLWENHIALSQNLVDPLWEARDELEMTLDLACRLGMGSDFWEGDYEAMVNDFLAPSNRTLNQLQDAGLHGIYLTRTPRMDQGERFDAFFKDLPNGKIQLYNGSLEKEGLEPLPIYHGEPEDPLNAPELAEKYPLLFTDEHSDYVNHHSWMRDIPWLRELRKHPLAKINPVTAKKYGLTDGDWIAILSPYGNMKAVALLTHAIRPDTVIAQHGWWQGCKSLNIPEFTPFDEGANPNALYNWEHMDPLTGDITKNTLVRIEKTSPPSEVRPLKKRQ